MKARSRVTLAGRVGGSAQPLRKLAARSPTKLDCPIRSRLFFIRLPGFFIRGSNDLQARGGMPVSCTPLHPASAVIRRFPSGYVVEAVFKDPVGVLEPGWATVKRTSLHLCFLRFLFRG